MKLIKVLIVFSLLLIALLYGLLFTPQGNSIVKPILEKEISKRSPLPIKVETLKLTPNELELVLMLNERSYIAVKGSLNILAQSLELNYNINIDKLSDFQEIIGRRLNGSFKTYGTVKGDRYVLNIDGKSDFANSDTYYHIELKDFKPKSIKSVIEHMQIDRLLYTLNQPVYTNGYIDINADIKDLDNLNGTIVSKIRKSTLDPEPVFRDFNISIPSNLTFNVDLNTKLKGTKVVSSFKLSSTINRVVSKVITYDLVRNSIGGEYRLDIPDLDKLYFLTERHMKGNVTITGKLKKSEKSMLLTGHSDTLSGAVDFVLKGDDLSVNVKNIQTVSLTDMLIYPHIFDSRANAKVDYNIKSKKGTLHAELYDGQILPNKLTSSIKKYLNFDITKEIYEYTVLDTDINDKLLTSNLHMKSRFTEISSKGAIIDLNSERIDSRLNIRVKKSVIPVTLVGALTKPSIKLDIDKSIRKKAVKKIESKVKKEIEKRLEKKIKNTHIKDLIKNLF